MSKSFEIVVNILLLAALVVLVDGLSFSPGSQVFGLLIGGVLLGIAAMLVEPILAFFRFPRNFWGLLLVGFVLNMILFLMFSTNILPGILQIKPGVFGKGFAPIPFFHLELGTSVLVAIVTAIFATLLQILIKRLAERR